MSTMRAITLYCQLALATLAAADVQYGEYILAPSSRTLAPASVYQTGGDVEGFDALVDPASQASTTLDGEGYVTLDFGKNIAGTVSFQVDTLEGDDEAIGFTFTESSEWISAEYCDATQDDGIDLPLWFNLTGPGLYEADKAHQRGGFRYLTVVHNATGTVSISNLTVYWITSPEMDNPAAYTGHFHSNSEKLNRVWYAGAYTNQLCSIDPTTGNSLGQPLEGWHYDYTISNGTSVLVDGGKRDRLIWPGDIAISGPSIFVSTNSLDPIRNGIDALFLQQQADGRLPYAGEPFNEFIGNKTNTTVWLWSFTYHCHTLNDLYDYYLFTGDIEYLESYWSQYTLGVNYLLQFIDSTGLANVTSSSDWLRVGMGGHNIEANSILYFTLKNAISLAAVVNDKSDVGNWTISAAGIPPAANDLLWDESVSLYRDNDTQQVLYPQDGNAWAIISGVANGSRAEAVSDSLAARWIRPYGAPAPEGGETISPFVSGFEIQAHYKVGRADRAVDLTEFMYADFMLDDPRMTNSSFIEGYSTNGSLHYPAYKNDPRVSHAHGWATGPTSSLSFLGAGIQLLAAAGKTWKIAPALGGLTSLEAGYETPLGAYAAEWHNSSCGFTGRFETPEGTSGSFDIAIGPGSTKLSLDGPGGITEVDVTNEAVVSVDGLAGGKYTVTIS
ncbi:Six-hairpin glycosidase-like protein [Truncatella angustata]|uniref:Six-hairpin glycosidase-like protein n=1 Tax=Truncatella angustata TaxID=152316 RepID=A0A9P8UU19_9PEZI|nr:Six-hairpin glycosidase-like protein [Truncatella angustata]KAH6658223.1 Six-hairpin glycosidase-like protein [Truncatella angustata]